MLKVHAVFQSILFAEHDFFCIMIVINLYILSYFLFAVWDLDMFCVLDIFDCVVTFESI